MTTNEKAYVYREVTRNVNTVMADAIKEAAHKDRKFGYLVARSQQQEAR